MTNTPHVRITLGSYDLMHPYEKQTCVYAHIPGVARVTYLLDVDVYDELKDKEWGDVLDGAHDAWVRRGMVSDSNSARHRQALREWLAVDENRDELNEAWFQHQAGSNPVSRKLLRDVERLREQNKQLQEQVAELKGQLGEKVQRRPGSSGEYLYCGADLGRNLFPYTCYRRIGHDGACAPDPDAEDKD